MTARRASNKTKGDAKAAQGSAATQSPGDTIADAFMLSDAERSALHSGSGRFADFARAVAKLGIVKLISDHCAFRDSYLAAIRGIPTYAAVSASKPRLYTPDEVDELEERINDFPLWRVENASLVDFIKTIPRNALEEWFFRTSWQLDGALERMCCSNELLSWFASELLRTMELVPAALDNGFANGVKIAELMLAHSADAFDAHGAQRQALAKGRPLATESRKATAAKNREALMKSIAGLFDSPEKPGWVWSNSHIANFLESRFPCYAKSTILKVVKTEAAKHRGSRKQEQARRFPIR